MNELVNGLLALKQVFDKHNIPFWLEGGTLLGAVREGKMIAWDNDVDISMWFDEVFKVLDTQKDLQQLGYELYATQGHYGLRDITTKEHCVCVFFNKKIHGYVVKLQFLRLFKHLVWMLSEPDYNTLDYNNFDYDTKFIPLSIRKAMVDICCKIQPVKRRKLIILLWKLTMRFKLYYDELIRSPIKCIDEFATVDFYGKKFSIPCGFDAYLSFMYGDWRVPVKGVSPNIIRLKDVIT